MHVPRLTALVAALLFGATVLAETMEHKSISIVVDGEHGGDYTSLYFNSAQMGFELTELQEGESRTFVDEEGRNVMVTREADGFKLNVDGETVALPAFDMALPTFDVAIAHDAHDMATWVGDVDVVHDSMTFVDGDTDGVLIFSGEPIDASTQETIRSVLQSAGHPGDVRFIDGDGGAHQAKKVKVVRKKVQTLD